MTAPMVCVPVEPLRAIYGMAREGCESPTAAYRWCERIDEVFHGLDDEYAEYARDLPELFAAAPAPPQAVQGEDYSTAMEGWETAMCEISEIAGNSTDDRITHRARRVRAWIEANKPTPAMPIAASGDVEQVGKLKAALARAIEIAKELQARVDAVMRDRDEKDIRHFNEMKALRRDNDNLHERLAIDSAALRSQGQAVAVDAKDAARYRWLRESSNLVGGTLNGVGLACGSWVKDADDKLKLDAAIDAALAQQANKDGG